MTSKTRTHKRRESYEFTPTEWRSVGVLIACPPCGGIGERVTHQVGTFGRVLREIRTVCYRCKGSGASYELGQVPTGPARTRYRSLCSNTGYANPDALKTSDDWDKVDCPACLACVWNSSPASKAKIRDGQRVSDAVAVILKVSPCAVAVHSAHGHAPHIRVIDRPGDPQYMYCPGKAAD